MSQTIASLVFTRRAPPYQKRSLLALLITLGVHAGIIWWAVSLPVRLAAPPKEKEEYLVDLQEPVKTVPEPKPAPAPVIPTDLLREEAPKLNTPTPTEKAPPATPPPEAKAGNIIAQEPDPSAPVDLSGDTFITGDAKVFAGGTTATKGTNDSAVHSKETDPNGETGSKNLAVPVVKLKSAARPVALDEDKWSCAWPMAADDEQIDEQSVIIRVNVDAKGRVTAANIVSDPGHGFGAAALSCALKTRFVPALDAEGRAIDSVSPPIRVRFTR